LINKKIEGDTYFPKYDHSSWSLINEVRNYDIENKFSYTFLSYKV